MKITHCISLAVLYSLERIFRPSVAPRWPSGGPVVAGYIINLSRLAISGHLSHSPSQPGLLTLSHRGGEERRGEERMSYILEHYIAHQ